MDIPGANPGQRSSETSSFTSKLFLKYNLKWENKLNITNFFVTTVSCVAGRGGCVYYLGGNG